MKKKNSRRQFISNSVKAGLAVTIAANVPSAFVKGQGSLQIASGFDQEPLPYAYNALEPVIDAMTMEIHYTKHAAAYAKNLKEALAAENVGKEKTLDDILAGVSKYSMKMRNNGGGHYNHELFWKCMKPNGGGNPSGTLLAAIESNFGSFDAFKSQFNDTAKSRFGSGWAWLVVTADKKLKIGSTPNQDNPLMDVSELKGTPLLGLDVWEHAYYLHYQNRRAEYVENWWKLVNWNFIQQRYNSL
jgi:Fe-Mn family superoxide dismutase